MNVKRKVILLLVLLSGIFSASAIDLSLDGIAEWGKFPRFCVNTYRWGCDFFNGYDTLYVQGAGHPFNVKLRGETWTDLYGLRFENDATMTMASDPSTSIGLYLTYLAVSVGYDVKVNSLFGGNPQNRKKFNFQFNCMLFNANLYFVSNDVGSKIRLFRLPGPVNWRPGINFYGINNKEWGADISYFFSHKRYSAAAAFNFSRIQVKSGGSFFAGFSYNHQNYDFDFNDVPKQIKDELPMKEEGYRLKMYSRNYLLNVGYGHNFVFRKNSVIGLSEALMGGLAQGSVDEGHSRYNFGAFSVTKMSYVYNYRKRLFAGLIGTAHVGLARNNRRSLLSSYFTLEMSVGFRFSLW